MKVLVFGTSYVADETRRSLVQIWLKLVKRNTGVDILIVDSCSPFNPSSFLPSDTFVFRFDDNIGAISRGQRDGAGRAFCKGLENAIDAGYDYAVHYESDFLFAPPIMPIIEQMAKAGVKVVSPGLANPYHFLEWGISFFDVKWVKETGFIQKYDWEHAPTWPIAEIRMEKLIGDDLFVIPFRGIRNEQNIVNVASLSNSFPYSPPDWISHCDDFNVYLQFLNINGIVLA